MIGIRNADIDHICTGYLSFNATMSRFMGQMPTLPAHVADVAARALPSEEKFDALRAVNRKRNAQIEDAADRFVDRLRSTFDPNAVPDVGDEFPNFLMPSQLGGLVDRDRFLQGKPAIISFNRGHWCFYCMLELAIMRGIMPRLDALGCRIVSIVPERGMYSGILQSRCRITFPVLSDVDNGFGLNLGLVVALTHELRDYYYARHDDIGRFQGNHGWFLPVPATFVVDGGGVIQARFAEPEYRMRMNPDDALRCLERICGGQPGLARN